MQCGVLVDVQQSPWETLFVVMAMGLLNKFKQKFVEKKRKRKDKINDFIISNNGADENCLRKFFLLPIHEIILILGMVALKKRKGKGIGKNERRTQ